MYFDALTIAAVASELRTKILDGKIQRVLLPGPLSIALEIYAGHRRHHLLISAHPRFARIHLSEAKPSRGVETDTPLLLLLRKYVVGGRIVAVEQPDLERVLLLSIVKRPLERNTDDPELDETEWDTEVRRCELIAEIMDQRSNIVLVHDDNSILESARHVTPRMSRRSVQPHEPYELPPPQQKRDPRTATAAGMLELPEAPDLARALVGAYRGISPLAAREIVFRATGRANTLPGPDLPWEELAHHVREVWDDTWQPTMAYTNNEPVAYAAYSLTHLPDNRPAPSMSQALEAYYAARERLTSHQQRRETLRDQIRVMRERLERQHESLSSELDRARELDRLRWEGEMIFAFLHSIVRGQTILEVEDRKITLDPTRTPVENAQERFRTYDKAKSALAGVPERLHGVEARIAGIDETLALLELAEGFEQIESIAREAAEEGFLRAEESSKRIKRARRLPPMRIESRDGFTIYVGRSAGQNEQVTFKIGAPNDIWLHARGIPGAHVIIKSGGREIPEQTLLDAAGLAAYFSAGRQEPAVEIDIARRAGVRRVPGGPTGLVTYRAEQTLRATPHAPW